jgi:tRNA uridine 5-carbamoylmethylation protein Kti12
MATVFAEMLLREYPEQAHKKEKLSEEIHKVLTSEEYLNKKAKVYMEVLTEEELKMCIEVVKLPGFKLMNAKRADFTRGLADVSQQLMFSEKIQSILLE